MEQANWEVTHFSQPLTYPVKNISIQELIVEIGDRAVARYEKFILAYLSQSHPENPQTHEDNCVFHP